MKTRIVLTDLALVTPLGADAAGVFKNLTDNKSGFSAVPPGELPGLGSVDAGIITSLAGSSARWEDLFKLLLGQLGPQGEAGCFYSIGTVFGGIEGYTFSPDLRKVIARAAGCREEQVLINTNTCAAGNFALQSGANLIRSGAARKVVCGGIDILSPYLFAGFTALRSLSKGVCRPFAADRDGLSLGEGGGLVVLQSLEAARAEGRPIYCEYAGFGTSCDLAGVTGMDKSGQGMIGCITSALEDAGIGPGQVDLISAHGTGTVLNDRTEAAALQQLFGDRPFIQAFKSYWGHCMGASSAIEAVLLALTFQEEMLIRINHTGPFEYPLNFVTHNRQEKIDYALNTAFGFGGINSCLVLKRFYDER